MTDFKLTKKTMYSTPMDVRLMLNALAREGYDEDGEIKKAQSILDREIEQHIYAADSMILGYLLGTYGEMALANETPYFMGPVAISSNPSPAFLRGIVAASTAITEQWRIKFATEDNFTVEGSFSGSQGGAVYTDDFTSTNSDIQIIAADWDLCGGTIIDAGSQFLVSTYITHPLIKTLSAKLAAAYNVNAIYSAADGEEPSWTKALKKEVMDMLKQLIDPKSGVSLNAITSADINPEAVSYIISEEGYDITKYLDIDGDVLPFNY